MRNLRKMKEEKQKSKNNLTTWLDKKILLLLKVRNLKKKDRNYQIPSMIKN